MKPLIAVILPTMNEYLNLKQLIPQIRRAYPSHHLYVVDDSTPEQQLELENFCSGNQITLIKRSGQRGRGSAVIAGLRAAAGDKPYDLYLEMDSDGSHDPNDIPRLVKAGSGADVVIGSRYLSGSSVNGLPPVRRFLSRLLQPMFRIWLGIPATDFTNGYRCYSPKAVDIILAAPLVERGFIVLSEVLFILYQKGVIIREIPIHFLKRGSGSSHAGIAEFIDSFRGALRIRRRAMVYRHFNELHK